MDNAKEAQDWILALAVTSSCNFKFNWTKPMHIYFDRECMSDTAFKQTTNSPSPPSIEALHRKGTWLILPCQHQSLHCMQWCCAEHKQVCSCDRRWRWAHCWNENCLQPSIGKISYWALSPSALRHAMQCDSIFARKVQVILYCIWSRALCDP